MCFLKIQIAFQSYFQTKSYTPKKMYGVLYLTRVPRSGGIIFTEIRCSWTEIFKSIQGLEILGLSEIKSLRGNWKHSCKADPDPVDPETRVSMHFEANRAEPNLKSFKILQSQVKNRHTDHRSAHESNNLISTVLNANTILALIGTTFHLK